jgi:hypothetical protein
MAVDQVVVHAPEGINGLLYGSHPSVGSRPNKVRSDDKFRGDAMDFSKFHFPEPIEPHKTASPNAEPSALHVPPHPQVTSKYYTEIRRADTHIAGIEHVLEAYDANNTRKSLLKHQELEEHYLQPLDRRLASKTMGPKYAEFRERRARAVTAFMTQSKLSDTFLEEMPAIPTIQLNIGDMTDPIKRYRKRAKREEQLAETVARSTGEWVPPVLPPEGDTMNLKKWGILAETRFYQGKGPMAAKGKRICPGKYLSSLGVELDQFDVPDPRKIRIRASVPAASVDHLDGFWG